MKQTFITFEGPEGSGKTSVIKAVATMLQSAGYDVLTTREPGGVAIAEQIRRVMLAVENDAMDAKTEALLFAASRRQHVVEVILPALKQGKLVICDRYVDSSLAYQGVGRGLGIETIFTLNQFAIDDCMPDLTLFIDVPPQTGLRRVKSNHRHMDRLDLETLSFHERVYEGYHQLIEKYPNRIKVIDGSQPIEDVVEKAFTHIQRLMN